MTAGLAAVLVPALVVFLTSQAAARTRMSDRAYALAGAAVVVAVMAAVVLVYPAMFGTVPA